MSTRTDIKNIIAYLALAFPNFHADVTGTPNTVDVYLDLLGDMPAETLQVAVKSCCAEPGRAFAPSAGEIRGMAAQLHAQAAGMPTAAEAWGVIMQSFHLVSSDRERLPVLRNPLVVKALRCMGGLEVIGMSENLPAERARFLQFYDELRERAMSDAAELPQVADYVDRQRLEVGAEIRKLSDRLAHKRLEATK
jgi:hypothetical protein